MKAILSRLSLNQRLAIVAGVVGFFALFTGSPYAGGTATINVKELALLVAKEVDHVTVDELADWIITGKADYRLVDLRSAGDFTAYHIPTAENIPVGSLIDAGLMRNEKIVLYSEGGTHSAQGWFLLKAQQYRNVYMLKDGLAEWKERILFPSIPEKASAEENAAFEKRKAVSAFFGGSPQSGGNAAPAVQQLTMPKLDMPAASAAPAGAVKKKKKEGC